jgi:hypothetical protein
MFSESSLAFAPNGMTPTQRCQQSAARRRTSLSGSFELDSLKPSSCINAQGDCRLRPDCETDQSLVDLWRLDNCRSSGRALPHSIRGCG